MIFGERFSINIHGKYLEQQCVTTLRARVSSLTGTTPFACLQQLRNRFMTVGGTRFIDYWLNSLTGHYAIEHVDVVGSTEAGSMSGDEIDLTAFGQGRRGIVLLPGAQGVCAYITWQSNGLPRKRLGGYFWPCTAEADYNADGTLTALGKAQAYQGSNGVFTWNTTIAGNIPDFKFITGSRKPGLPTGDIDNFTVPDVYSLQRRRTLKYAP